MGRRAPLFLDIIRTDRTFQPVGLGGAVCWEGKCIHCNTRLLFDLDGEPLDGATIEHILPRTHGGDNTIENVAASCARCNNAKGRRLDHRHRFDPDLVAMIDRLQDRRRRRWRDPASAPDPERFRIAMLRSRRR